MERERERERGKGKKVLKHLVWADEVGLALARVGNESDGVKRGRRLDREGARTRIEGSRISIPGQRSGGEFQGGRINDRPCQLPLNRLDGGAEAGGAALKATGCQDVGRVSLHPVGEDSVNELRIELNDVQRAGKKHQTHSSSTEGGRYCGDGGGSKCTYHRYGSYKEALMRRGKAVSAPVISKSKYHETTHGLKHLVRSSLAKRCFRCLASDHKAAECRDPPRCLKCLQFGHRAKQCNVRGRSKVVASMFRPHHRQGREPSSKVFVPYTKEYLRRHDLRRNAVLADVIRPADLGANPISTIKNALARRFGGYVDDFGVSRYRERDFAIFLPEWVPADMFLRREMLTLNDFWIRCYPWGRYRNAGPHRSTIRAWIRLINLPFEIWTIPRVAAIVGGFGRFVRADATTKALTDLRAFRCQVVLDSVTDVPQNLTLVLGEEEFSVMVHIESWERVDEGRGGDPPMAPPNADGAARLDGDDSDDNHHSGGEGGLADVDDEAEPGTGEVEEGEAPRQSRPISELLANELRLRGQVAPQGGRALWVRRHHPRPRGGGQRNPPGGDAASGERGASGGPVRSSAKGEGDSAGNGPAAVTEADAAPTRGFRAGRGPRVRCRLPQAAARGRAHGWVREAETACDGRQHPVQRAVRDGRRGRSSSGGIATSEGRKALTSGGGRRLCATVGVGPTSETLMAGGSMLPGRYGTTWGCTKEERGKGLLSCGVLRIQSIMMSKDLDGSTSKVERPGGKCGLAISVGPQGWLMTLTTSPGFLLSSLFVGPLGGSGGRLVVGSVGLWALNFAPTFSPSQPWGEQVVVGHPGQSLSLMAAASVIPRGAQGRGLEEGTLSLVGEGFPCEHEVSSDLPMDCEAGLSGLELVACRGEPVVPSTTRTSKRRAIGARTHVLLRAMSWKASLREGGGGSGTGRAAIGLVHKSMRCGVCLEESEAKEFKRFLGKRV